MKATTSSRQGANWSKGLGPLQNLYESGNTTPHTPSRRQLALARRRIPFPHFPTYDASPLEAFRVINHVRRVAGPLDATRA